MSYGSNTYKYDSNGLRVQKNGIVYYNLNGRIIYEKLADSSTIFYNYDQDGLTSLTYKKYANGTYTTATYYIRKNLQGDIIALHRLIDNLLVLTCKYRYDAWGRCTVLNPDGTVNTDPTFIGNINPIRYRGYYYDTETGLYYLQSRYYDPETGRFINADDGRILGAGLNIIGGSNLFSYCFNNPVCLKDNYGLFPETSDIINILNAIFTAGLGVGLAIVGYTNYYGARPANIGIGTFSKQTSAAMSKISKACTVINKLSTAIGIFATVLAVGEGIYTDINRGYSTDRLICNAVTNTVIYGAIVFGCTKIGAIIGTFIPIPVAGTVIGAAIGCGIGIAATLVLEAKINDKKVIDYVRDFIYYGFKG